MNVRSQLFVVRVAVLMALALPADSQVSTASITGTVRDPGGGTIPEAELVLTNTQTGVERRSASNSVGNYVFLDVPSGIYILEATKVGFAKSRLEPFTLAVNQTATLDFTLSLGSVEQTVTVHAVAAAVQSSTAELGAVVPEKIIHDLPLNGRNFTQLLTLTPGASPANPTSGAGGSGALPVGQFIFPVINGGTGRSNFFMLDGVVDLNGWSTGAYAVAPILDAIQEFKVQSHNDQAEFGDSLGGIINVVTKSGTNELHGGAWEFVRNDAFDARNFFQRRVTPFRWNQFGATSGGPVVLPKLYNGKNKTFFFLAYEGFRRRRPAEVFHRVPTEANYTGDLSDEPRQIYNPFSTRSDPTKPLQFMRDPFPGNRIPANLLDPGLVLYAKSTLPKPIVTGVSDRNALDTTPGATNQEEYSARVDHTFGSKDFFWFRWSGTINDTSRSGGRQAVLTTDELRAKNIGISFVHTFSPTSILEGQFGYLYNDFGTGSRFRSLPPNFATGQAGFSENFVGNFAGGIGTITPNINVVDWFSGGDQFQFNSPYTEVWQYKANYSKIRGNHTLKIGGEFNATGFAALVLWANLGFGRLQTADPQNPGNTGSALASFLLNVPNEANRRNSHETIGFGGVMGVYFQDQWKVSPKLTLNLGLRYGRTFLPRYGRPEDENDFAGDEDLIRGLYVLQKVPGACETLKKPPCIPTPGGLLPEHVVVDPRGKVVHDTTKNFGPRLGIAYRLSQRTAIRTSFGINYDQWAAYQQSAQNIEGTWPSVEQQFATNLNLAQVGQPIPNVSAKNPFPSSTFPDPTPFNQFHWFFDPYMKNGYSMQWNFGIQHQLTQSTLLTTNYVGSGSRRQPLSSVYNTALTPGPGKPQLRAQYPYQTPSYFDRSWGRSNYESLQMQLERRFSGGLAFSVTHTWAKTIDIGCSGWYGFEGCSVQDPYHFNNDRSVAGSDVRHVFVGGWVYELPIGSGKPFHTGRRVADYVIGNWQLNGLVTLRSGLPYNIFISSDIANIGNVGESQRPNLVGDPNLARRTARAWFNAAAFAVPAPFTFGNLGRYAGRSDWGRNVDLSLFRQFPIRETRRLEFRADAFNVTNTPVFGIPSRNMNNSNFGQVTSTSNTERQLQLALKIIF